MHANSLRNMLAEVVHVAETVAAVLALEPLDSEVRIDVSSKIASLRK